MAAPCRAPTYTGTPDGREGWAQYFVRRGYAVYVVDQPGRGRSGYLAAAYGPTRNRRRATTRRAAICRRKSSSCGRRRICTRNGRAAASRTIRPRMQMAASQLPEIEDFTKQQFLNRDALVALLDKIGPSILLVHSQAGAFGWPVADARPDLVKAIVAIEPNGPPFHGVEFIGAPDWFKEGTMALPYGITAVPLTYAPAVKDAVRAHDRAGGQGRRARPGDAAGSRSRAGAATAQPAEDADHGADLGGVLSRALRPLHGEVSAARPA